MRRLVVLVTLSLAFIAPLAVSVAEAADGQAVRSSHADCRRKPAKKSQGEPAKKKDKDKDKKPYGFEL